MDSLIDLFNTVLKIAFFGGFILLIINILKFKKNKSIKTEILNLQAKLSKARMALKGKVIKKSRIFRASFTKTTITEGDMLDNALKELASISFETSESFQKYFDLSRKIVNFIQIENKQESDKTSDLENNFMCSDFKTEMDIVRIIREMTNLSARVNNRIQSNNTSNPSKSIKKIDSLIFDSIVDINRIFKSEKIVENSDSDSSESDDSEDKAS